MTVEMDGAPTSHVKRPGLTLLDRWTKYIPEDCLPKDQLHVVDEWIKKLNENIHEQAVHIKSLIHENSRLSIKLLLEKLGNKTAWWKIGKVLYGLLKFRDIIPYLFSPG